MSDTTEFAPRPFVDLLQDRLFRTIFEQSPVSTQVFAPDGECVMANAAWERRWGTTLERLGGYNILNDRQLEERGAMPLIRRAFDGEAAFIPAIRYVAAETVPGATDVAYRWAAASIYPVKDDTGVVSAVVLMHEDITERKEIESALAASEALFRSVFQSAPVGVAVMDEEGRYIEVNPVRAQMLGYAREDLLGKHYLDVTHPDDVELDQEINARARSEARDLYQLEKRFMRKGGTVHWARVTVALVPDSDPPRWVSITEDTTEQHSLDRQKTEFLSAVAHDLRTPLTSIRGRAHIVQQRLARAEMDPDRIREEVARIDAAAVRMSTLVTDLLDVANVQLGRPVTLTLAPTNLVDLVRGAAQDYAAVSEHHTIAVRTDLDGLIGQWDATRLERVLANLLSNALKYSPEGGEIEIEVRRDDGDREALAVLSVSDPGIGIRAEDLPRVFERFSRGNNVDSAMAGAGIGLSVVREVVEQHGGRVSVESAEGVGSTFTVRLPIAPPGAPEP